jgi:hypothetical protein
MKKILIWVVFLDVIFVILEFASGFGCQACAESKIWHYSQTIWQWLHYPASEYLQQVLAPPPVVVLQPKSFWYLLLQLILAYSLCILQMVLVVWGIARSIKFLANKKPLPAP